MDANAAKIVTEAFVKAGLDALEALLSVSFDFDVAEAAHRSTDELTELGTEYSVWFRAPFIGGGSVAMLLTTADATRLLALVLGEDPDTKTAFTDDDAGTLREIADAVLGGGVGDLSDLFGEDVELEAVEAVWDQDSASLAEYLGEPVTGSTFTFKADPHFDSAGVIAYTQSFESRVPGGPDADVEEPLVSNEEMKDILEGFTPDDEIDRAERPSGPSGDLPANLAVILDIEMVATARLGKIEVPIAEVLNMGPGSIVEMGHLVDEPVELLVNDKLVARGDVVVVDEKFGLRITEIISQEERIESLR